MPDVQDPLTDNQIILQRTSTQRAHRTANKTGIDLESPNTDIEPSNSSVMLPNSQNEEADIM